MDEQVLSERQRNWKMQDPDGVSARRVFAMNRVIVARRQLFAALDDCLNHGFSESEMDELYEHERTVLKYIRFCQKETNGGVQ